MLVAQLDRHAAAQLYLALRDRRLSLERVDERMPRSLVAMERAALAEAKSRQQSRQQPTVPAPSLDAAASSAESSSHAPRFATNKQAARDLDKSQRTIERWVANGTLATVPVGKRRRIVLPYELRPEAAGGHG